MLLKIIKLKNIGLFQNYCCGNLQPFKKATIIYGQNGTGKTTISTVLSCLKSNTKTDIKKRQTFGTTEAQEVEILLENGSNVKFENDNWQKKYKDFEIFDIHFINDNIFSANSVSASNRKKLHSFVVGEKGVDLTAKISKIDQEYREYNSRLKDYKTNIEKICSPVYKISEFIKLKNNVDIDKLINQKEKELKVITGKNEINNKSAFNKIDYPRFPEINDSEITIDITEIKTILSSTLESIQNDYLKLFDEHKSKIKSKNAENWIKAGYDSIIDNKCPFCTQGISDDIEIIKAYNQHFNQEYTELKRKIALIQDAFFTYNFDTQLNRLNELFLKNSELTNFWKQYIEEISLTEMHQIYNADDFKNITDELKLLINNKAKNPLQSVDFICSRLLEILKDWVAQERTYNIEVEKLNSEIEKLKLIPIQNLDIIETDIKKLQIQKLRYSDENINLVEFYNDLDEKSKNAKKQKDADQKDLDEYTTKVFSKYVAGINSYLQKFNVPFSISKIEGSQSGSSTEQFIKYEIQCNSQIINLEEADKNEMPTVRTALSEGDKSAIALSFFLSKLDLDDKLSDKIVVFDDPLSSFDSSRKTETVNQLINLIPKINQLIVFSHNSSFLKSLFDRYNKKSFSDNDFQTFQLIKNPTGSELVNSNIDEIEQQEYIRMYNLLDNFLTVGTTNQHELKDVADTVRVILEYYLRFKYPKKFSSSIMLCAMNTEIRNSATTNEISNMKVHADEIEAINDYSLQFHHPSSDPIDRTELEGFIKRTMIILHSAGKN